MDYQIKIFKCPNCGNDIRGENYRLIEREGHFRINLNEGQNLMLKIEVIINLLNQCY